MMKGALLLLVPVLAFAGHIALTAGAQPKLANKHDGARCSEHAAVPDCTAAANR